MLRFEDLILVSTKPAAAHMPHSDEEIIQMMADTFGLNVFVKLPVSGRKGECLGRRRIKMGAVAPTLFGATQIAC